MPYRISDTTPPIHLKKSSVQAAIERQQSSNQKPVVKIDFIAGMLELMMPS
jgi:hypothetical protein